MQEGVWEMSSSSLDCSVDGLDDEVDGEEEASDESHSHEELDDCPECCYHVVRAGALSGWCSEGAEVDGKQRVVVEGRAAKRTASALSITSNQLGKGAG